MSEQEIIRMQKMIEAFILGKLDQKEIDLLWIEFLKEPEWYDLFETELHLRSLAGLLKNNLKKSVRNSFFRVHIYRGMYLPGYWNKSIKGLLTIKRGRVGMAALAVIPFFFMEKFFTAAVTQPVSLIIYTVFNEVSLGLITGLKTNRVAMAESKKSTPQSKSRLDLMKVAGDTRLMGTNFHIYVRNRMPSIRTLPEVENDLWNKVQNKLESSFEWLPEHRFVWNELDHVGRPYNHYGIHLKGGVTCYLSDANKNVEVIFDSDSDRKITDQVIDLLRNEEHKPKNRVGLIQMSYGTLNVKFVEYRPYELEITPFLGEEITALKQEMLQSFHDETKSGLYLIHGKPGTGKTSFLKEILYQTDKQALFIPPSIAGELSNPNLLSLLMDHADSILIIEDAETVLMRREADNSDAVSNLLNLTDGFPSDFLNLNVICTFNTNIQDIDPALLRKGRLKAIQEFREMDIEHGRKLAEKIGSDVDVDREMTVAEVCNVGPKSVVKNCRKVGYDYVNVR